jgi:hypothetical protein
MESAASSIPERNSAAFGRERVVDVEELFVVDGSLEEGVAGGDVHRQDVVQSGQSGQSGVRQLGVECVDVFL